MGQCLAGRRVAVVIVAQVAGMVVGMVVDMRHTPRLYHVSYPLFVPSGLQAGDLTIEPARETLY